MHGTIVLIRFQNVSKISLSSMLENTVYRPGRMFVKSNMYFMLIQYKNEDTVMINVDSSVDSIARLIGSLREDFAPALKIDTSIE